MRFKQDRRKYYRGLKESFPAEQYRQWNNELGKQLQLIAKRIPKNTFVAAYMARPKEADLSSLFPHPFQFCFPRVIQAEQGHMEFFLVEPKEQNFEPGAFDILEPKVNANMASKEDIKVAFIPLLAFDSTGRRLGQGKGFYDRFLDGFKGWKIGVGFEWQYSPEMLPTDIHDQTLHSVITEKQLREFYPHPLKAKGIE